MAEFKSFKSGETEQQFRRFMSAMLAIGSNPILARTAVLGASGLTVRQTTTASASVTIDAGVGVVQAAALDGVSPLVNDTTKTLDVLGANPMGGLPRNDVVVFDAATESIRVIVGTPAAVPSDPTVPSSALPLARLSHAASATTVPSGSITDLRVFTATRGGFAHVRNTTERSALERDSQAVIRADAKTMEFYDGAQWRAAAQSSDSKAGKRIHWGSYTAAAGRTDGYRTITHGAGFTPTAVVITPQTNGIQFLADTFTSTTFRVRILNSDGSINNTDTWVFSAFLGE